MKKSLLIISMALLTAMSAWADVEINETNFPDENFRNYLLSQEYGADGILTDEEIAGVTELYLSSRNIQSLKGIEYFTALTMLYCLTNQLTSLDVSQNTALTSLNCGDNQLTSLDVSGCTALKELQCYLNQLTSLDISKNTVLEFLNCWNNQLTSLDVSGCTVLKELQCDDNQLTSLDVSKNTVLTKLNCGGNQLSTLDISKNTALESLICNRNQLTKLDVSNNTALTRLYCNDNQLTSLDVSNNTALTYLSCGSNQLSTLDISKNTALTSLNCGGNLLTSLDVSQNTALKRLDCWPNQLTSLDVSGCTALTQLYCSSNQLTSLDVSLCTALKELDCVNNQLTSLDVSKNTALTWLYCSSNQLTSLDVSNNTALTYLSCGSTQLSTLDISKNTALTRLECEYNQLTSLDVSKNTALTSLYCCGNQLTSLDVSKNTKLYYLSLYSNQIKGAGMDALVKSLPTVSWGDLFVIDIENEQNVMTKAQVAAAKAKGWDTYSFDGSNYQEYEGSEPEPVIIAEETTVNPSENAEPGQATTTESGVTTSLGDEDVVDAAEGSVTIVSSMTNDAVKELIETTQPGSSYFNETFKGFYFLLAAGKGKVEFDIETSGGYSLGVMKGSELVGVYTQSTKGTVTIPYDLEEDTWFFAYPVVNTPAAANRAAGVGALKVYGLRIIPEESGTPDGINNLAPAFAKGNGVVYNLQGQRTDGLQKGLNIVDGKKVWVK